MAQRPERRTGSRQLLENPWIPVLAIHIRALRPTTSNYRSNWFIMTFGNVGFASPSNDDEMLLANELRAKMLSLRLE